jgi:predicted amidohydrolase YtcJ
MELVAKAMPPLGAEDRERAYLAAQASCLSMGLTGVHDAGLSFEDQAALKKLDDGGKLVLRVYGMASADAIPVKPIQGSRFELRAVKAYADGALGSRGAALLEPYSDDPSNTGLVLADEAALTAIGETCLTRGFQLCTHAIGDRGNRIVLDAYAAAARKHAGRASDLRWRIEHCQVVAESDFARFRELGVIASMQPTHATSDGPWAPARLGEKRLTGAYAWRRFLELDVPLAFGSDFPVESADPRLGIFASLTRRPPDDSVKPPFGPGGPLTPLETLKAFTYGAAYASFHERDRGRLEVGRAADFTVFDRDVFQEDHPDVVLRANVVWTIVGGVLAHPR